MPEYINKETAIGKLHDYKHDALCEERLFSGSNYANKLNIQFQEYVDALTMEADIREHEWDKDGRAILWGIMILCLRYRSAMRAARHLDKRMSALTGRAN